MPCVAILMLKSAWVWEVGALGSNEAQMRSSGWPPRWDLDLIRGREILAGALLSLRGMPLLCGDAARGPHQMSRCQHRGLGLLSLQDHKPNKLLFFLSSLVSGMNIFIVQKTEAPSLVTTSTRIIVYLKTAELKQSGTKLFLTFKKGPRFYLWGTGGRQGISDLCGQLRMQGCFDAPSCVCNVPT